MTPSAPNGERMPQEMDLRALLEGLRLRSVVGPVHRQIESVVSDSRLAGPRGMFVAIRGGQERDRHAFIPDAVARGVEAVVLEDDVGAGSATRILVEDCRRVLPALAARLHGYPARGLTCVGVTGTNGKTTTAVILRHVLDEAGQRCAYIGTLGYTAGPDRVPLANTTPEASQLQELLARARAAGCRAVSMEVSSHALALDRVREIDFRAAVFTNLTRDHLDFHGSAEAYLAAKMRLFESLGEGSAAVLNADDPSTPRIAGCTPARVYTFGVGDFRGAHVHLRSAQLVDGGTHLDLDTPAGELSLTTTLTGRFNWSNVMAAVSCSVALGVDLEAIRAGIAAVPQVPGRFERIDEGQPFHVIVDYAHTPAGLETVLAAARELTPRRLLCVFGCGGDRDAGKRPLMGRVAEEHADLVFLTSDNPRSESPQKILDQIAAGMQSPGGAWVCADRRRAIRAAIGAAQIGDVVVVAGKGAEPHQILADRRVPFDDRVEARSAVRQVLRGGVGDGDGEQRDCGAA